MILDGGDCRGVEFEKEKGLGCIWGRIYGGDSLRRLAFTSLKYEDDVD